MVPEREWTEAALEESERRYADLLSSTRAFVYRCLNEPGWPIEFASAYALELTGYAPEKLLVGGTIRFGDLVVEEDRQRVWDEVQTALQRRERFKIRYTIRHRDGTPSSMVRGSTIRRTTSRLSRGSSTTSQSSSGLRRG